MKFRMGDAISEALEAYKQSLGRLLLNALATFGIMLIPAIAYGVVIVSMISGNIGVGGLLIMLLLTLAVIYLAVVMQSINICIVSDKIDNYDRTYGEQFHYTFTNGLRILGANLLVSIPVIIVTGILIASMLRVDYTSLYDIGAMGIKLFAFVTVISLYMVFTVFTSHSILLEEKGVVDSISRSFRITANNYLKMVLFYIVINVLTYAISYVTRDVNVLISLIISIAQLFFSLYIMAFITTLFKQVEEKVEEELYIEE